MSPTRPSEVKAILERLGVHPNKTLSQNFLIDANILRIMLDLARPAPDDVILEIGPGLGALTGPLLEAARKVIAIEKDGRLCQFLREQYGDHPRLALREADALDISLQELLDDGVTKLVSNLPYGVGNRILVSLTECERPPPFLVVTVQRDVAERMASAPGSKTYGALAIWLQSRYRVAVRKVISPTCFYPPPHVQSAIVELVIQHDPEQTPADRRHFHELVKHAFMRRRKQLRNALDTFPGRRSGPTGEWDAFLAGLEISPSARPEELAVADWVRLSNRLAQITGHAS
jgi:16S rRNA (adenine1518-N6/adenine1519-N6)-dimethyltransferase